MTTAQIEKTILSYTKGLPVEILQEILDFIQFVREKRISAKSDNLNSDLSLLNESQVKHLEAEFKNYKQLYPRE